MSIRVKATIALLLIAFAAPLATPQPSLPPLPGSRKDVHKLQSSTGVLVATLLSFEGRQSGPMGMSRFHSRWKVRRTLRGDYADEVLLTFLIATFPEETKERMPDIGKTYIVVTHTINEHDVARMFDDTEENLTHVQRLINDSTK